MDIQNAEASVMISRPFTGVDVAFIEKEFAKVMRTLHEIQEFHHGNTDAFLATVVCYLSTPQVISQMFYSGNVDLLDDYLSALYHKQNEQITLFLWWSLTDELMIRIIYQCSISRGAGKRINLNQCDEYVKLLTILLPPGLLEETQLEIAQNSAMGKPIEYLWRKQ